MHKATYIADAPTTSITPPPPQPLPAPQNRPPCQLLLTPKAFPVMFFSISPMIYYQLVKLMTAFKTQPNKGKHNLAETKDIKKTCIILMFEKEKPFIGLSPHFFLLLFSHASTITHSETDQH